MILAIMQPYFIPYAGYFRLFTAADQFVIYDCVQFPRRGWVHRNRLPDALGRPQWLTLPLVPAPQEVAIRDLQFPEDAKTRFEAVCRRFPLFAGEMNDSAQALKQVMDDFSRPPVDYLESTLRMTCEALEIPFRVVRSSTLGIPAELDGQDRILAIAERLGAKTYVNAPGGRALYDEAEFQRRGIALRFLADYQGGFASIFERLAKEDRRAVAREIRDQS